MVLWGFFHSHISEIRMCCGGMMSYTGAVFFLFLLLHTEYLRGHGVQVWGPAEPGLAGQKCTGRTQWCLPEWRPQTCRQQASAPSASCLSLRCADSFLLSPLQAGSLLCLHTTLALCDLLVQVSSRGSRTSVPALRRGSQVWGPLLLTG